MSALSLGVHTSLLADLNGDHFAKRLGPAIRVPDTAKSTNSGTSNGSLRRSADAHTASITQMPRSLESRTELPSRLVHGSIFGRDLRNRRPPRTDSTKISVIVPSARSATTQYPLQCEQIGWRAAGLRHVRADGGDTVWLAV